MRLHRIILSISLFFTLQTSALAGDGEELREELNFILTSNQDLSRYEAMLPSPESQKKDSKKSTNPLGLDTISTSMSGTEKDFVDLDEIDSSKKSETKREDTPPLPEIYPAPIPIELDEDEKKPLYRKRSR